jgi:hypothetical protein
MSLLLASALRIASIRLRESGCDCWTPTRTRLDGDDTGSVVTPVFFAVSIAIEAIAVVSPGLFAVLGSWAGAAKTAAPKTAARDAVFKSVRYRKSFI